MKNLVFIVGDMLAVRQGVCGDIIFSSVFLRTETAKNKGYWELNHTHSIVDSGTWEAEARTLCKFETSLLYIDSSGTIE